MSIRGFWKGAQAEPSRVALVDIDGREITAGELLASANQIVHGLRALGLQQNDVVAMLLPNGASFLELLLATQQAGWHIVVINNGLTASELGISYLLPREIGSARAFDHYAGLARSRTGLDERRTGMFDNS